MKWSGSPFINNTKTFQCFLQSSSKHTEDEKDKWVLNDIQIQLEEEEEEERGRKKKHFMGKSICTEIA